MFYIARQFELMGGTFKYIFLHKNKQTQTSLPANALTFKTEIECQSFINLNMQRDTKFVPLFIAIKTNNKK